MGWATAELLGATQRGGGADPAEAAAAINGDGPAELATPPAHRRAGTGCMHKFSEIFGNSEIRSEI